MAAAHIALERRFHLLHIAPQYLSLGRSAPAATPDFKVDFDVLSRLSGAGMELALPPVC